MDSSTPTRRDHLGAETRDYASLGSVARQIAAARTRPFALSTQTSSFEVLRRPRPLSPTVIVRSGPASLAAARPPHSPRPNPQIQPRPQPHAPHEDVAAESIGGVLVQTVTQLADQVAAQSAAQITAFSSMLRRFDDLRAAVLPMPSRPPLPPNALSAHALVAADSLRFGALSAPAPVYQTLSHADAYAPLIAALPPRQQSFELQPASIPPTIVASAVAPTPSTVAVFAAPSSVAQHPPQALNATQPAALPPAALSQLPTLPVAPFAADWEEKDAYTLLKLSGRARFVETSGNKIRGFIADLELFLQMCGRPVHHWGFFLLASLGTEEAEKVRRSHVAESVADYPTFKKGVETLFAKFEFEGSFRAKLRTHTQAGAETVAAYAARTTDVCSKAYPNFSTDTQLSLAVDYFVYGLADPTTRDYLLHDRACRALTW